MCCLASRRLPIRRAIRSAPGNCRALLPPGTYRFTEAAGDTRLAALAFALGGYQHN